MRLIATFLLIGSLLQAGEYMYRFDSNGIPKTRTNQSTGVVEVYTNIASIKASESVLHRIHEQSYSDMSYEHFLAATKQKHPNLIFQRHTSKFYWLEHSEYLHLEELPNIDKYITQ